MCGVLCVIVAYILGYCGASFLSIMYILRFLLASLWYLCFFVLEVKIHTKPSVPIAYQAIKLRSRYVPVALLSIALRTCTCCLLSIARRTCDVCKAPTNVSRFLNRFKNATPLRTRRSCSVSDTEAFKAVEWPWRSLRF